MNIQNCIVCEVLVPEIERKLDLTKALLEEAIDLLSLSVDEGRTWDNSSRLLFMKSIADVKKKFDLHVK
jgi:hypothetical protein